MSSFRKIAALAATFLCLRSLAQAQQPSEPIRVNVDRVNVGVIVTDSPGQFVEGLRREDFHVFDDSVEQPLTDFAAVDEPAQVVLLIESGPAVYLFESEHLRAARGLLEGLSAGDRVAIIKYAEAPQQVLDFTANKQAGAAALERLHFNLGFGQLNLSSSLSTVLDGLASAPRKKSVVLLSTGVDTSPESTGSALLSRLRASDVRVLAVSLSGDLQNRVPEGKKKKSAAVGTTATAEEFAEADQFLRNIADATGGRAYFPKNAREFSAAYAEIAQLVRHEYSLAFMPPARDGKVHAIEVRVNDSGTAATRNSLGSRYRVDHRRAYVAPAP